MIRNEMFKNGCIYLKSKDADLISITNNIIVTKERRYVLILMVWLQELSGVVHSSVFVCTVRSNMTRQWYKQTLEFYRDVH